MTNSNTALNTATLTQYDHAGGQQRADSAYDGRFTHKVEIRMGLEFWLPEATARSSQDLSYHNTIQTFLFSTAKKANDFMDANPLEGSTHYSVGEWVVDEYAIED
jgi:hypothetical protein